MCDPPRMGPAIREYPLLLRGESQQSEALVYEIHKGKRMVTSSGERNHAGAKELKNLPRAKELKNHLGAKELKKSPPRVKPPPSKIGKNVCIPVEKSSCQATENRPTNMHGKGKKQLYEGQQPNRTTNVCTSSLRAAPRLKKELVPRKPYETEDSKNLPVFKYPSWSNSSKGEDVLIQSFYCKQKERLGRDSEDHPAESGPCSPVCEGASADAMFLDFASLRIMKEDSDEDSASDLSDSERIPIPPSPCTPPELNLRAEEIDPLYFEHLFDAKFKQPDYYYPDFLPPPYNTWDLKGLAVFVNTECKSEPEAQPVGFLEKYIDRLLELEWLQLQTIEAEKGKAARGRPQTAPVGLRTLKSPGKSKLLHSPLLNKPLTPHESFPRLPTGHSGPRQELQRERGSQIVPCEGKLKAAWSKSGPSPHQRRSGEGRNEAKQRPPIKQQPVSRYSSDTSSMIQGAGNIRPLKQPSAFHSPAVPLKGLPAHTGTNPKKNGNANSYLPSKKASGDKKLKASGAKPASCKFK
uniref:Protein FAM217B isoform X1 n=1 Tax=Pogona vitticeps TaxID=103695 RepID=A0A6J0UIS7_9SAUR